MTIARYLNLNELNADTKLTTLSEALLNSLLSKGLYHYPIHVWQKMFTRIQSESKEAISLLALLLCLDRTNFPLAHFEISQPALQESPKILSDYSFISTSDKGERCSIPRLVHLIVQERVLTMETAAQLQVEALLAALDEYNNIQADSRDGWIPVPLLQRDLLPHVDVFEIYCKTMALPSIIIPQVTPALVTFAGLYVSEGRYTSAQRFLFLVLQFYKTEDIWRIKAFRDLAETIRSHPSSDRSLEDELGQARNMLKEARRIAQKIGDRDIEIDVLSCVAMNYCDAGRFSLAEQFGFEVKHHKLRQHGPFHLELVDAMLALSQIHYRQGIIGTSEKIAFLARAEEAQRFLLNTTLPGAFPKDAEYYSRLYQVQAALARTNYEQGRFEEAARMAFAAKEGRTLLFGIYGLKTLGIQQYLALCLLELGRVREAEELLSTALERLKLKLGPEHILVKRCAEKLEDMRGIEKAGASVKIDVTS